MTSVNEALGTQRKPLGAALAAGLENISYEQELVLTKYLRLTLPADGFAFWVNASILKKGSIPDQFVSNGAFPNQSSAISKAPTTLTVKCSIHYTSMKSQEEEESYTTNEMIVTSEDHIEALNQISPWEVYIGEFRGLRFAFSSKGMFYEQAALWHYRGIALLPDMTTQIIDNPADFNLANVIVSNSLPIWLSINRQQSYDWQPLPPPSFKLYASYLVPANLEPPFASVYIDPDTTESMTAGPLLGPTYSHYQQAKEKVRITFWGLNNYAIQNFLDYVGQFTLANPFVLGLMNSPIARDLKKPQTEFNTIAQKKVVDFEVNYIQSAARNISRQTLQQVLTQFDFAA